LLSPEGAVNKLCTKQRTGPAIAQNASRPIESAFYVTPPHNILHCAELDAGGSINFATAADDGFYFSGAHIHI
jgi:hypothetical protein